jgi:hypothetical protein
MLDPSHLTDEAKTKIELDALMHTVRSASNCRLIASMLQAMWSREIKRDDFLQHPVFGKMWDSILTTPPEAAVTISRLHDTRSAMLRIEEVLDLPRSGVVDEWMPVRQPNGGFYNLGWADRMSEKLASTGAM